MMHCFQVVSTNSEQILNLTVDGKKTLVLCTRLDLIRAGCALVPLSAKTFAHSLPTLERPAR